MSDNLAALSATHLPSAYSICCAVSGVSPKLSETNSMVRGSSSGCSFTEYDLFNAEAILETKTNFGCGSCRRKDRLDFE